MKDDLIDNVWTMIKTWNEVHFGFNPPKIVLIASPNYYHHLKSRGYKNKIYYIKSDYQYGIDFFEILWLKVPVIIDNELPKNVEYTLMFKKDYERLEKEKLYMKLNAMFD